MYILLLLLIGVIVYFVIANKNKSSFNLPGRKSPEDILNERFASGEIDEQTYRKMKGTLRG